MMKIPGEKLFSAMILCLLIEWWCDTLTYVANKNNILGLGWIAIAGMTAMGLLALILKKVNFIVVAVIEFFSVVCWSFLLYSLGYVALFYFSQAALMITVALMIFAFVRNPPAAGAKWVVVELCKFSSLK